MVMFTKTPSYSHLHRTSTRWMLDANRLTFVCIDQAVWNWEAVKKGSSSNHQVGYSMVSTLWRDANTVPGVSKIMSKQIIIPSRPISVSATTNSSEGGTSKKGSLKGCILWYLTINDPLRSMSTAVLYTSFWSDGHFDCAVCRSYLLPSKCHVA